MVFKLVAFLALVVALLWLLKDPKWESGATAAGAAAIFVGSFFTGNKGRRVQTQEVSKSSVAVQAGRDVSIGGGVGQNDRKE